MARLSFLQNIPNDLRTCTGGRRLWLAFAFGTLASLSFAPTGLVPVLWATGAGSDVMKRIAAPMVGGIFTSFLLELLVYPAIYELWRWHGQMRGGAIEDASANEAVYGS